MAKTKQEGSKGVTGFRKNVPIDDLKADPKNPRTWDSDSVGVTRASIRAFGFVEAIVNNTRTGFMVAGHQRRAALLKDGAKTVPLVIDGDWTAGDARALSIVLNGKPTRGRFVVKRVKVILDELAQTHGALYGQLGLGTILEQAEAEESGAAAGKKKVEFEASKDGWETFRVRVPPGVRAVIEEKVKRQREINEYKTDGEAVESIFADYEPHRVAGVGG